MKRRTLVGWILALIRLLALPTWAVEYRLQVTNLDDLTFSSYIEKATPWWRQNAPMGRLEARLAARQFPPAAVLPGREVQLLEDPAYGGKVPARIALLPAIGQQAWTTFVWDGNPGDTVAFLVKSEMAAWQEVPEVSQAFLANAVDRGTFPQWVARHAKASDGLSIVVGRGLNTVYDPDRVYLLITLPPEPHTFKALVGWRDHDNRESG